MLDKRLIEDVIMAALSTGGDFAEVFVEDKYNTGITMIGGKVDSSISGRDFGIGIRIFRGFNSVYAYTNQHNREILINTAIKASKAIQGATQDIVLDFTRYGYENINPIKYLPNEISKINKVQVMREAHEAAKNYNHRISQVTVRYIDEDLIFAMPGASQVGSPTLKIKNISVAGD